MCPPTPLARVFPFSFPPSCARLGSCVCFLLFVQRPLVPLARSFPVSLNARWSLSVSHFFSVRLVCCIPLVHFSPIVIRFLPPALSLALQRFASFVNLLARFPRLSLWPPCGCFPSVLCVPRRGPFLPASACLLRPRFCPLLFFCGCPFHSPYLSCLPPAFGLRCGVTSTSFPSFSFVCSPSPSHPLPIFHVFTSFSHRHALPVSRHVSPLVSLFCLCVPSPTSVFVSAPPLALLLPSSRLLSLQCVTLGRPSALGVRFLPFFTPSVEVRRRFFARPCPNPLPPALVRHLFHALMC